MSGYLVLVLIALTCIAFFSARHKSLAGGPAPALHSRPGYHGAYVAAWVGFPALLLVLLWQLGEGPVIDRLLMLSMPPAVTNGADASDLALLLSEIKSVARGQIFGQPGQTVIDSAARLTSWRRIASGAMVVSALALALVFFALTRRRIATAFRARHRVERLLDGFMIACSLLAVLTTLGIAVSLLIETARFFARVSPLEFFFGLNWQPQIPIREDQVTASGAFGAIPVFMGTLLIATLAMMVAIPVGLLSAVYLTQYAGRRIRAVVKPLLEILAGIPTVVYGFFAVLVVAPAMRQFGQIVGLDIAPNSAMAAGGAMGIMLIPFISSLSDDAISAVPTALRDGSYALGATSGETIVQVLLPAALPGIMGGILLAVSRAIGETMIVVMAAGIIATLTLNPFEPVTTVTVQIVTLLIGDTEFDNPKTLAAFALGLTLFAATLALNVLALRIVRRYRERYD